MPESSEANIHSHVMYEARDVDASVIGWVAVGVIVSAFMIYGIVKLSYGYFARAEFRGEAPATLVRQSPPKTPGPLLQVNPAVDLERLQEAERQTLSSYGWVDQKKGIVRIPIEEAMKLVVQRGLPAAEKASPTPTPDKGIGINK